MIRRVAAGTRVRPDALRALMAERGWSRAELARQTGIRPPSIGPLMDGSMRWTGDTIALLLRAFARQRFEDLFCVCGQPTCACLDPAEESA